MENETNLLEKTSTSETYQTKETPTIWKWYFGWNPRLFFSVPIFLVFAYQGLWFIWAEIQDVVFFFQHTEVTWGGNTFDNDFWKFFNLVYPRTYCHLFLFY